MSQGTVNPQQVENGALQSALRMVPFSKIVLRPEENSFRDKDDFTGSSINELAEDIVANGILTPFLCVENEDDTVVGLDGHRRGDLGGGIGGGQREVKVGRGTRRRGGDGLRRGVAQARLSLVAAVHQLYL